MEDLIIVLPGIMGSVLSKDGREFWAPSLSAAARLLQREALLRDLMLDGDDPERPTLDDGVTATRLFPDAHLIPGFWKIDGYSNFLRSLVEQFRVREGALENPDPQANLFPFPYDWRRDNRANALRLKTFIDAQLPRLREHSPQARVILIGHSMGGLIARYYLEVLGGWEHCRALFTLGTPYKGSPKALDYLSSGFKKFGLDVSPALRSYTSVYQLLPTYQMIERGEQTLSLSELTALARVDLKRVKAAREQFHDVITVAATERAQGPDAGAYLTTIVAGVQQETLQSATLDRSGLKVGTALPRPLSTRNFPNYGDNTVPFFAALPQGARARDLRPVFVAESHGALQNNGFVVGQIHEMLHLLQMGDLLDTGSFSVGGRASLNLQIADAYPAEGGRLTVQAVDAEQIDLGALTARLTSLDGEHPPQEFTMQREGEQWVLDLERPTPGLYRVSVRASYSGASAPLAVSDLFEVLGEPAKKPRTRRPRTPKAESPAES
jgi:pimeloyl-ACP methyl ester carboxylesterase